MDSKNCSSIQSIKNNIQIIHQHPGTFGRHSVIDNYRYGHDYTPKKIDHKPIDLES